MRALHIASEATEEGPRPGPDGVCHAVEVNARSAMCGCAVDGLHLWPDVTWDAGVHERCGACVSAVAQHRH